MPYSKIAHEIRLHSISITPNFLRSSELECVQAEFKTLYQEQAFSQASVGQGAAKQVEIQVRQNELLWLDSQNLTPAQKILSEKLEGLRIEFNRTLYLGLQNWEAHYALYPKGGFYQRHRDAFRDDERRVVSLILYLNEKWSPGDGGELRVYSLPETLDVLPQGGTLVCFLSQELEHEVLMTNAPRMSFTAWLRRE